MEAATLFSSLGVSLLLMAFLGTSFKLIAQQSLLYWLLNLIGGILATIGAALIGSIPFLLLESVWTVASGVGLVKWLRSNKGNY
ncbi:MAG: hypothetical protein IT258_02220 [Saprospiraceae bacterium]|nr:hypothetical protein [Saprospiraceae bacterium]